jgi:hypothetical protein
MPEQPKKNIAEQVAEETGLPGGASWLITVETRPLDPLAKRAMVAMELGRDNGPNRSMMGFLSMGIREFSYIPGIIPVFQMKS